VTEQIASMLDVTRLLLDLQQATEIAQRFSGCLQPGDLARCATEGLVAQFKMAFARIWLVEPDYTALRLVASSGLYTRIDGSFARVPMGAYKVGKIAQNRVSFLSNALPEEPWVKDREWAIAHQIRGFAGFPLMLGDRVLGVLAVFSHSALSPEFLEVLKVLCAMLSVSIDLIFTQQTAHPLSADPRANGGRSPALSDQLATFLGLGHLTLMGTEQSLSLAQTSLFLQVAEHLSQQDCRYCRLIYGEESVILEALVNLNSGDLSSTEIDAEVDSGRSPLGMVSLWAQYLGGQLSSAILADSQVLQMVLTVPYASPRLSPLQVRIQCQSPLLQLALTQLAAIAQIQVLTSGRGIVPLLTDDEQVLATLTPSAFPVIWVGDRPPHSGAIAARVDLSLDAQQLHRVVEQVNQGRVWDLPPTSAPSPLSAREQEIFALLGEGLRDRDIAQRLIISESTVKFHVNNVLAKLNARTRFQALYQVVKQGWI
jgi:DNA-binding CsgD family transcriptional regulator